MCLVFFSWFLKTSAYCGDFKHTFTTTPAVFSIKEMYVLSCFNICSLNFFPPSLQLILRTLCILSFYMRDGSIRSRLSVCSLAKSWNLSLKMKADWIFTRRTRHQRLFLFLLLLGKTRMKTGTAWQEHTFYTVSSLLPCHASQAVRVEMERGAWSDLFYKSYGSAGGSAPQHHSLLPQHPSGWTDAGESHLFSTVQAFNKQAPETCIIVLLLKELSKVSPLLLAFEMYYVQKTYSKNGFFHWSYEGRFN